MNPDEAINVEGAVGDQTEAFAYSAHEEREARIPSWNPRMELLTPPAIYSIFKPNHDLCFRTPTTFCCELSSLIAALTASYGGKQAGLPAQDWLEESNLIDSPPRSEDQNWRAVTIAAVARLADRITANLALTKVGRCIDN